MTKAERRLEISSAALCEEEKSDELGLVGGIIVSVIIISVIVLAIITGIRWEKSIKPKDYLYECEFRFGEVTAEGYSINEYSINLYDVEIEGIHYDKLNLSRADEETWICVANEKEK